MKISEALAVLNLPPGATAVQAERAFRSLAQAEHPHKGGSTERMAELNAARELLMASAERFAAPELDAIKRLRDATADRLSELWGKEYEGNIAAVREFLTAIGSRSKVLHDFIPRAVPFLDPLSWDLLLQFAKHRKER